MTKLHDSPYVMNSFLEQFPELVTARGGRFSVLCEEVGLPVEMATGKHQLIPFDKFVALLELADETLSYPEISFDLARHQSIDAIGPVTQIIESCETVGEALFTIVDYLKVLTSGFDIRINRHDHFLELCFDVFVPVLLPKRQFQVYLLASSVSVLRHVMKNRHPMRSCFFSRNEFDASLRAAHRKFFACPVVFGADEIKVHMDSAILNEPVTLDSSALRRKTLGLGLQPDELQAELTRIVTLSLSSGNASLSYVATSMGYSERTLRRRLSDSNLSFSQILRAVRFEQANRYLQSTHYKLSDIAALLGYSNQGAFSRSYKNWCGISPSDYRCGLLNQD